MRYGHSRLVSKKLGLVLFCLLIFFSILVAVGREIVRGMTLAGNLNQKEEDIEALSARAHDLAVQLDEAANPRVLEEAARQLGLGRPGETSIIIPSNQGGLELNLLISPRPSEPFKVWWQYFVDPKYGDGKF